MKVLNNSLKLKDLLKNYLLLIAVVIIIAAVFSIQIVNHVQKQPKDAYAILQKQRFVFIQNQDDLDQGNNAGAGFDLKDRELFLTNSSAIKDGILYEEVTSAILNLKVSKDEIEKSNYIIERDPKSLITKSLVKEEKTPEFEARVLDKTDQFSKVRITYNQDYLPIKLEWYFKGKDGLKWYTWSRFSYPYKSEAEFNKKLDEEIQRIKDIEKEHEAEVADG